MITAAEFSFVQPKSRPADMRHFNSLPPEIKQVYRLRKRGIPYRQIARVLRIPMGTVQSRLARARRAVRASKR